MAVLVLQNRDAAPRVPAQIVLDAENAMVVGRSRKEADVCLDLPAPAPPCLISRRHARLRRDGASWFVADLGSLNGVSVNDARLHQERKLVEGDVVRFGGAGGEELGGECATYVFSAKRRSSLLRRPVPRKDVSSLQKTPLSMPQMRPAPLLLRLILQRATRIVPRMRPLLLYRNMAKERGKCEGRLSKR